MDVPQSNVTTYGYFAVTRPRIIGLTPFPCSFFHAGSATVNASPILTRFLHLSTSLEKMAPIRASSILSLLRFIGFSFLACPAAPAPDIAPCNNTPASPPTRSPAVAPSGCSPGRMPDGGAALPLLCNLIYSLQPLLSQFKDYYSGFWITKQIIINRVRRLVKNCIYPVVFIIYITFRQIPPCHFIPSLFPPLNVNFTYKYLASLSCKCYTFKKQRRLLSWIKSQILTIVYYAT